MERRPEDCGEKAGEAMLFVGEPIPSIQLLPGLEQPLEAECGQGRREKKASHPLSINNFIQKTYAILQEKQFEDIVSWAEPSEYFAGAEGRADGRVVGGERGLERAAAVSSFRIFNLRAFEEVVLPRYFKHSNMSSFVRQLNMYSFHKVRGDKNEIEFQHEKFIMDRPDLLAQIRRKQVDSSSCIPSVAAIPAGQDPSLRNPDPLLYQQTQKEAPRAPLEGSSQSPQKKGSFDQGPISEEEEKRQRLSQLQEVNRSLKRVRQQKSMQLKQLVSENRIHNCDKFNKLIFSLFALKVEQERSTAKGGSQREGSSEPIHRVIEHLVDTSEVRSFRQYMEVGKSILRGGASQGAEVIVPSKEE